MKTGSLLAIIVFLLVALAHLARLVYGAEVIVAGTVIPQWVSVIGLIIPALIAFLLWKESKA
jgi:hypothetical protein